MKEKYGKGYRKEPPRRNRRVWEHFLARNLKLARNNYKGCAPHIQRVVRERERFWKEHPQGEHQAALLSGEAGLYHQGVIYALMNEESWFCVDSPIYIGQSVDHVIGRTMRHVDKAIAGSTKDLEPKVIDALRKTKQWWQKWVMMPLEVISLPTNCKRGTQAFLDTFRASATVREQAWIRQLRTGFPGGLNIEVHQGNPETKRRHEARKTQKASAPSQEWQQVPFSKKAHFSIADPSRTQPDFHLDASGLHFSREPGDCASIRRMLADYVDRGMDEAAQKDFLHSLSRNQRRRMVDWLAKNTP